MRNAIRMLVLASVLLVLGGTAQAANFTIDFTNPAFQLGNLTNLNGSGIDLDMSANLGRAVAFTTQGVGVAGGDPAELDSFGPDEELTFDFSGSVHLVSVEIVVVRNAGNGAITLTIDGPLFATLLLGGDGTTQTDFIGQNGESFVFGTAGTGADQEGIFIKSITISTPEPASLGLLGGALVLLGVARRRLMS